jgi:hypothetical protein
VPAGLLSWAMSRGAEQTLRETSNSIKITNLYNGVIGLFGTIAVLTLFMGVAEGHKLTLGGALRQGGQLWVRVFGARFRMGITLVLWALLLIVPGIWKAVLLMFVTHAAIRVRDQDPLAYSTELVKGRFWQMFGASLVFALIIYLPIFAVSAGLAVVNDLVPTGPVIEVVTDWISRVGEGLGDAFVLATFYGVHRSQNIALSPLPWRSTEPTP